MFTVVGALVHGTGDRSSDLDQPSARDLFGLAVHHAVRARFCIARGRRWQAEHWIGAVRDHALELACLRRGLDHRFGRGFDQPPVDVLGPFESATVRSLDREELLRTLRRRLRSAPRIGRRGRRCR